MLSESQWTPSRPTQRESRAGKRTWGRNNCRNQYSSRPLLSSTWGAVTSPLCTIPVHHERKKRRCQNVRLPLRRFFQQICNRAKQRWGPRQSVKRRAKCLVPFWLQSMSSKDRLREFTEVSTGGWGISSALSRDTTTIWRHRGQLKELQKVFWHNQSWNSLYLWITLSCPFPRDLWYRQIFEYGYTV